MGRDLTECPDCGMAYEWHDAEKCYHIQKSKLKAELQESKQREEKLRECLERIKKHVEICLPDEIGRKMSAVWLLSDKCLKELGE